MKKKVIEIKYYIVLEDDTKLEETLLQDSFGLHLDTCVVATHYPFEKFQIVGEVEVPDHPLYGGEQRPDGSYSDSDELIEERLKELCKTFKKG